MPPSRRAAECPHEHVDPMRVQMDRERYERLVAIEQDLLRERADAAERIASAERKANDRIEQANALMVEAMGAQKSALELLKGLTERIQDAVKQERESSAQARTDALGQLRDANTLLLRNLEVATAGIDKLRGEALDAIKNYAALNERLAGVLATRAEGQERIELKKLEVERQRIEAEASAAFQNSILTQIGLLGQSFVKGIQPKLLGGGGAAPTTNGHPVEVQAAPAAQAEAIPDNPVISHPQIGSWKEVTARVILAMPDIVAINLCWIIAVNRILEQPMAQTALSALPPDLAQAFVQLTQMAVAQQAPAQSPQSP